jgi:hypothetical protein
MKPWRFSRRAVLVGGIALIGATMTLPRRRIAATSFFSDGTNFRDGLA